MSTFYTLVEAGTAAMRADPGGGAALLVAEEDAAHKLRWSYRAQTVNVNGMRLHTIYYFGFQGGGMNGSGRLAAVKVGAPADQVVNLEARSYRAALEAARRMIMQQQRGQHAAGGGV